MTGVFIRGEMKSKEILKMILSRGRNEVDISKPRREAPDKPNLLKP